MGEMSVPESALYGASTQRAVLNFPISGYRFSRPFIRALGLIKWAAAQANADLGLLDTHRCAFIVQAAEEVVEGKLDEHFPLDIFQTGSGTSTNTNANEVIANRCLPARGQTDRRAGSGPSERSRQHGAVEQRRDSVRDPRQRGGTAPALPRSRRWRNCTRALDAKAKEFWDIIKIGRTHLMDATPVRLGQEFSGYARQVVYARERAATGDRRARGIAARRHRGRHGLESSPRISRQSDAASRAADRHRIPRSGKSFRSAGRERRASWKRAAI